MTPLRVDENVLVASLAADGVSCVHTKRSSHDDRNISQVAEIAIDYPLPPSGGKLPEHFVAAREIGCQHGILTKDAVEDLARGAQVKEVVQIGKRKERVLDEKL